MKRTRVWKVPVYAYATTSVRFETDIDPGTDPEGFKAAFWEVEHDFPRENVSNDFEIDGDWDISLGVDDELSVYEDE
jgi:hypothetical protein